MKPTDLLDRVRRQLFLMYEDWGKMEEAEKWRPPDKTP